MMLYHPECKSVVPHNPKCGGVALQHYFQTLHDDGWQVWQYTRICDVQRRFSIDLTDWLAVAQIRNPYERTVSYYEHARQGMGCRDKWRRQAPKMTFEQFVHDPLNEWPGWYERCMCKKYYPTPAEDLENHLRREGVYRYWYVWDRETGALHPNLAIVRLETLSEDWSRILGREVKIPKWHFNRKRGPVENYYTPELCEIVEARHAWAFNHWYKKERPLCHAA
jgi:hypothetical protein